MKPELSVLMSVYNEEPNMLCPAIESILNQSFRMFEFIIVVDNPKNKVAIDIIDNYRKNDSRIMLIVNSNNIGLANSMNLAASHARGRYLVRMDSDDISDFDRLKIQYDYLRENPNCDFVYTGRQDIDEAGK